MLPSMSMIEMTVIGCMAERHTVTSEQVGVLKPAIDRRFLKLRLHDENNPMNKIGSCFLLYLSTMAGRTYAHAMG
jgi:hypothetical protein